VIDSSRSSDGDKCFLDNNLLAEAKPAADAFMCYQNKPLLKFLVPMKHELVSGRNVELVFDEQSPHVNVARPVVMHTLTWTQKLSAKCPYLHSSLQSQSSEPYFEPYLVSQSKAKDSSFIDTANDSVVNQSINDSLQTLTVADKDALHAPCQQRTRADVAVVKDLAPVSNDADKHSGLNYLFEKVVDTQERSSESSFTDISVRTQRLICRDSQLKRIANKNKLISTKASAGSLLMSRNNSNSGRLSLKDAVDGTRPHTYSLLEVAFRVSKRLV